MKNCDRSLENATRVRDITVIKRLWTHDIKDNERNPCQDLLTIESSDLHALHYANEILVGVRLAFQKLYLFIPGI